MDVERQGDARCGGGIGELGVAALGLAVEHPDLTGVEVGVDPDVEALGHDDDRLADAGLDLDRAAEQGLRVRDLGEVELELADAVPVVRVDLGGVHGCRRLGPDPAVGQDGADRERHGEEDADADQRPAVAEQRAGEQAHRHDAESHGDVRRPVGAVVVGVVDARRRCSDGGHRQGEPGERPRAVPLGLRVLAASHEAGLGGGELGATSGFVGRVDTRWGVLRRQCCLGLPAAPGADHEQVVDERDRHQEPGRSVPEPATVADDGDRGQDDGADEASDAYLLLVLVEVEPVGGDALVVALGRQQEPRGGIDETPAIRRWSGHRSRRA